MICVANGAASATPSPPIAAHPQIARRASRRARRGSDARSAAMLGSSACPAVIASRYAASTSRSPADSVATATAEPAMPSAISGPRVAIAIAPAARPSLKALRTSAPR